MSFIYNPNAGGSGGGFSMSTVIEDFLTDGAWTPPAGLLWADVYVIAAGGGGASGRVAATGAIGGTGGGAGQILNRRFFNDEFAGDVAITVGIGGAGGATQSTPTTDGIAGAAGGSTSFGAFLTATGGLGGLGTGAALNQQYPYMLSGASYFGLTALTAASISGNAARPGFYVTGGASGSVVAAGVPSNGSTSPSVFLSTSVPGVSGGTGGIAPNGNASDGFQGTGAYALYSSGGGGGAATSSGTPANAGNGGNGGRGSGGGGGGGGVNGFSSGAGGNGGNGFVRVISYVQTAV